MATRRNIIYENPPRRMLQDLDDDTRVSRRKIQAAGGWDGRGGPSCSSHGRDSTDHEVCVCVCVYVWMDGLLEEIRWVSIAWNIGRG